MYIRPPLAARSVAHLRTARMTFDDGTSGSVPMLSTTTALVESATLGQSSSMRGTSANSPTPA